VNIFILRKRKRKKRSLCFHWVERLMRDTTGEWALQQSPTNTVEKIVLDEFFDPKDPVKIPATISNKKKN
jgi:hypothetical protein